MSFQSLISDLPRKSGSIYTLEKGKQIVRTYSQLYADIVTASALLRSWGVAPGMRVGIYAPNSYEWLVNDLALIDIGAVSMAFTNDFDGQLTEDTLVRYGVSLLLISKQAERAFPGRPRHIAFIDAPSPGTQALPRDFIRQGDEDDHLTLVFSSGSSGGLKGLVISRKGACATIPPIMDAIGVTSRDRLLLFLPLSNFQQRFLCYAALRYDFELILTDFGALFPAMIRLHPTILLAPPVFYQMVHNELSRKKRYIRDALAVAASHCPSTSLRQYFARVLFPDLYKQFGNSIRLLITGMAPIRRNIGLFFSRAQLPLCEAYGMVEAGVMAYRCPKSKEFGSVGQPLSDVRFDIESDGELIVSRPIPLTLRYFQCSEGENERTFMGAGRIATGDIGRLNENGDLFISGRKGETIVTSAGHKVHPEVLEREINNVAEVANSVVFQRADATHLSCIVSLNCPSTEEVAEKLRQSVRKLKTVQKVSSFIEIILTDAAFTRENGMLRPNMKIDRRAVVSNFGKAA